ncbi:hypothetical protein MUO74_06855 [Candidatus Bathyarchaeota archaeon]|nr:hypothetical protein [Candidatus Bathyarchaeota archaeon]
MSKDLISGWFERLSDAEKNLPLLILGGVAYTPRAVYDEVMRDSPLGNQLQALVDRGSFGTSYSDEQSIAKLRLTEIMRSKPDKPLFATLTLDGQRTFTPSELLQEIQNDTDVGKRWVSNEAEHMRRIVSVR